MANWITQTNDEHTRGIDAICLSEAIWYGDGAEAYRKWNHGIYEWRDLCWRAAPWLTSAWEKACELEGGEAEVCFDSEFCPALGLWLLEQADILSNPYSLTPYHLQRFVEETYEVETAAEQLKRLLNEDADPNDIRAAIHVYLSEENQGL